MVSCQEPGGHILCCRLVGHPGTVYFCYKLVKTNPSMIVICPAGKVNGKTRILPISAHRTRAPQKKSRRSIRCDKRQRGRDFSVPTAPLRLLSVIQNFHFVQFIKSFLLDFLFDLLCLHLFLLPGLSHARKHRTAHDAIARHMCADGQHP